MVLWTDFLALALLALVLAGFQWWVHLSNLRGRGLPRAGFVFQALEVMTILLLVALFLLWVNQ